MKTKSYNPELTRKKLVDAAAREIWRVGFRAASLDLMLKSTEVTKGALYHHFINKEQLGFAVIDDIIRRNIQERWVFPLVNALDPIDEMMRIVKLDLDDTDEQSIRFGCPLNNLAQEMSCIDEGFRIRVESVFDTWRAAISTALKIGQQNGTVRENFDPDQAALFIMGLIEGAKGMVKIYQDKQVFTAFFQGLVHYLEALRPRRQFRGEQQSTVGM